MRKARGRLDLTVRDVEELSQQISKRHGSDEFTVFKSRLSEIENHDAVPSIFRLYSLCAIYRIDFEDALGWYGIDLAELIADAGRLSLGNTHPIGFQQPGRGQIQFPLTLDPGFDARKTTDFNRMIQRWGRLPLALLGALDPREHRYGFIGSEDWSMYPILSPGSLVVIDESRKKPSTAAWDNEFARPIYLLETRDAFYVGWCSLDGDRLTVIPHHSSGYPVRSFLYPQEIEILGQVVGVAMRLDLERPPRTRG